jgi:tellurite resistance protein TehA-like permease
MSATRVTARSEAPQAGRARRRIPPNFLAIPFGLTGLAGAWHAAGPVLGIPPQVAGAFYALAAAVWLVLVLAYLAQGPAQIRADLRDSVLSPYVALAVIAPMLLAAALAPTAFTAARVLVVIFLAVLMVIVQARFIPVYARLSFTPGFWSFTFAYAAVAADASVAARTLIAIRRRQFFPAPARA